MLYQLHKKSLCASQQMWKILKEMGIPDHLTCLLRNLCAGQEATVRTLHEQLTGSQLGKEYKKAEHCHSVYLTYMQSTSCVHHWFNGHEFGQTLRDGEGQGILVCCNTWGFKELDMTWRLNNTISCKILDWWITSCNQDCREKYQQPQTCRWYHSNGRKRRAEEPLDEGEREEWKIWLKTKY